MGYLEWQTITPTTKDDITRILYLKESILFSDIIPCVLLNFLKYVKRLNFEDTPDYLTLIDEFKREIISLEKNNNK